MIKDSKEHLFETKENYLQNFKNAFKIGFTMIIGNFQAILHALITGF
jgi:hypothetical protein